MKQTLDSSISDFRFQIYDVRTLINTDGTDSRLFDFRASINDRTISDFRFTMYHSPAVYGWGDVIGSSLQPRRKETRRQGDKGTGRGGDKGTRGQGDKGTGRGGDKGTGRTSS